MKLIKMSKKELQKGFIKLTKRALVTYLIVSLTLTGSGLFFLFNPFTTKTTDAAWFNDNWGFRKAITLTITSSASDISNLQTLLTVDTTGITANLQTNCEDLRFTSQTSGNILPYYIDTCSDNAAANKIWIMADLVPKNTTTYTMYMYYGNPSAPAVTSSTLFDNVVSLEGYWTMNDASWNGTAGEVKDSSANANNGTGGGSVTTTTGTLGNAGTFDGTDDNLNMSAPSTLDITTPITIELWVKPNGASEDGYIMAHTNTGGASSGYGLYWEGSTDKVHATTTACNVASSAVFTDTGAYVHIVYTDDGSTGRYYRNGATAGTCTSGSYTNSGNLTVGKRTSGAGAGVFFAGDVDDFKIYSAVRTATQISNDYNNKLPNGNTLNIATTAPGTIIPTTQSFATEEKAPSPVAYWKFDDGTGTNADNATTNSLDGTISGSTWQTEDACISGKCLFYDGSDDVTTVTNATAIDLNDGLVAGFTVSAWVFANSDGESDTGQIFFKGTNTYLRVDTESSGSVDVQASLDLAATDATLNVSAAINTNKWNHIALTWTDDGDDEITIYVNGVSKGSSSDGSGAPAADANNLLIGGTTTANFHGKIDEFRIYNSEKTAAQILSDYNSRSNPEGVSTAFSTLPNNLPGALSNGLVGYWKEDEASGNAADSSGNAVTLTNNATTPYAAGKFANAGSFTAASSQYFSTATTLTGVKTVAFWVNPTATTDEFINLTSSAYITASSGTVSATGFTSPSIYINGVLNGTITASAWNHVVVTTDTAINANAFEVGRANASYVNGKIDETRIYNRALTSAEITQLYNFAPGPVGYWKMDENSGTSAFDNSGNAYTGTLTSGPTWKPGKYGSSVSFTSASSQYIASVGGVSATSFIQNTGSFTTSAWVKFTDNTAAVRQGILGNSNSSNDKGMFLLWENSDSTQRINLGITRGAGGTVINYYTSNNAITDNNWHYVTATGDGTSAYIYVDGVSKGTGSNTLGTLSSGDSHVAMNIGRLNSNSAPDFYFNGQIDDTKIYNYARSADQVVSDMNAGHPSVGSPVSSPVGFWKFDEGYGTTAYDTTPNANNLTLSSSSYTDTGKFNKAWNGTGVKYLSRADDADFDFAAAEDFSISLWYKSDSASNPGATEYLVNKQTSSAGYAVYANTSGNICFGIDDDATWTPDDSACSTTDIYDNTWHYITATKTGTSRIDLYVDGRPNASDTSIAATGTLANSALLYVGDSDGTDNGDEFNGDIDELKIYRYALTASQVPVDQNRGSAQVLGALSDNSSYQPQAANQEYCVPGDTTSCAAPVARYDFEEGTGNSVFDTSGNGYVLTWSGTGTRYAPGRFGKAGNFVSSVPIYANAASPITSGGAKSFGTWFKTVATTQQVMLDNNGVDSSQKGIYMIVNSTANKLTASSRRAVGGTSNFIITSSASINDGKWHFGFATWDGTTGTNGVKLYIDGVLDTQATASNATDDTNTRNFHIGAASDGAASAPFDGQLDHVLLYNYARTPAQVAWDYNRGAPIGHWKLDECQGDKLNDSAGNSLTATVTNTTPGTCTTSSTFWGGSDGTGTGKRNYAPDFDGSNDVATVTNASAIDFDTGLASGMSFAAWIYADSDGEGDVGEFLDKGANTYCRVDNETGGLDVECQIDLGTTDANVNVADAFATGGWHHIVISYDDDGDDDSTIYIDGISRGTGSGSGAPATTDTNDLLIGGSSAANFDGKIDDFRVYNYGLTATQVKELYGGGAIRYGPVTGAP